MSAIVLIFIMICTSVQMPARAWQMSDSGTEAETRVRQFGEEKCEQRTDDAFVGRVTYPYTGIEELDAALTAWVGSAFDRFIAESVNEGEQTPPAELTIDYDSYVAGGLASVKLSGTYSGADTVHIVAAFNADINGGKLLMTEDVFVHGGIEKMCVLAAEAAGIAPDDADEGILDNWLITPDGIEIILMPGEYLPESKEPVRLLFGYDELEGICILPGEAQTEEQPRVIDPDKPMLAITFDDGPTEYTAQLLDIFAEHGVKGTFFLVGNRISSHEDVVKRMADEGHEICGHSWDHSDLTTLTGKKLTKQFTSTRKRIRDVAGVEISIMRPPYGAYNKYTKRAARSSGFSLVLWSIDTLDWKLQDADKVYDSIMEQVQDGAILLCHDTHLTTVEAMERVIPELLAQGYQLVTVTELLTSRGRQLKSGGVYSKR